MIQFPFDRVARGTDAPFRLFLVYSVKSPLPLNRASQTVIDLARHGGRGNDTCDRRTNHACDQTIVFSHRRSRKKILSSDCSPVTVVTFGDSYSYSDWIGCTGMPCSLKSIPRRKAIIPFEAATCLTNVTEIYGSQAS